MPERQPMSEAMYYILLALTVDRGASNTGGYITGVSGAFQ